MSVSVKDFDVNSAKAKIRSIRNAYTLEHYKVLKSYKSGTSANTLYKPTVSWFPVADILWKQGIRRILWNRNSHRMPRKGHWMPRKGHRMPSKGHRMLRKGRRMPRKGHRMPRKGHRMPREMKHLLMIFTRRRLQKTNSPQAITDEYKAFGQLLLI